jgi:orotidine-5'-phosphate decarboxylase
VTAISPEDPRAKLCLALDVAELASAEPLIDRMRGEVGVLKVGLELYTAEGPAAVRAVQRSGARCFLDLKLHDIPATVAKAVSAARSLGVDYLTVHASSGRAALEAAVAAAGDEVTLLAVTVLTSLEAEDLASVGMAGPPADAVSRLAKLAIDAGVPGLVCSPKECARLRAELGPAPRLVVPGIRPAGASLDDQQRAATPAEAIRDGASILVVGRPIRGAADPVAAARAVVAEIAAAASSR